jgi:hypothetical protein
MHVAPAAGPSMYHKLIPPHLHASHFAADAKLLSTEDAEHSCRRVLDDATTIVVQLTVDRSVEEQFRGLASPAALSAPTSPYVRRVRDAVAAVALRSRPREAASPSSTATLLRVAAGASIDDVVATLWQQIVSLRRDAGLPANLSAASPYVQVATEEGAAERLLIDDLHLYLRNASGVAEFEPLRRYKQPGQPGARSSWCGLVLHPGTLDHGHIAQMTLKARLAKSGVLGLPPFEMVLAIPPCTLALRRCVAQEATERLAVFGAFHRSVQGWLLPNHALALRCLATREETAVRQAHARHAIHEAMARHELDARCGTVANVEIAARAVVEHDYIAAFPALAEARERLELLALCSLKRQTIAADEAVKRRVLVTHRDRVCSAHDAKLAIAAAAQQTVDHHVGLHDGYLRATALAFDSAATALVRRK